MATNDHPLARVIDYVTTTFYRRPFALPGLVEMAGELGLTVEQVEPCLWALVQGGVLSAGPDGALGLAEPFLSAVCTSAGGGGPRSRGARAPHKTAHAEVRSGKDLGAGG